MLVLTTRQELFLLLFISSLALSSNFELIHQTPINSTSPIAKCSQQRDLIFCFTYSIELIVFQLQENLSVKQIRYWKYGAGIRYSGLSPIIKNMILKIDENIIRISFSRYGTIYIHQDREPTRIVIRGSIAPEFAVLVPKSAQLIYAETNYIVKYNLENMEEIHRTKFMELPKFKGINEEEINLNPIVTSSAYLDQDQELLLIHALVPTIDKEKGKNGKEVKMMSFESLKGFLIGLDISTFFKLREKEITGINKIFDVSQLSISSNGDFALYTSLGFMLQVWNVLDAEAGAKKILAFPNYFEKILEWKQIGGTSFVATIGEDRRFSLLDLSKKEKFREVEIFYKTTPRALFLFRENSIFGVLKVEVLRKEFEEEDEENKKEKTIEQSQNEEHQLEIKQELLFYKYIN